MSILYLVIIGSPFIIAGFSNLDRELITLAASVSSEGYELSDTFTFDTDPSFSTFYDIQLSPWKLPVIFAKN